jgi:DNA-binding SARP family transcriptional activator
VVNVVDCRILGPVVVEVRSEPVRLYRRQVRHLLALLLLDVGRPLSTGRLADLLWPDDPPDDSRAVLMSTVSRLRAALATVAGIEVVRQGDGYAVDTDPEVVDAYRFRRLVERAAGPNDAATRSALAGQALSLWRGPALADVGTEATRGAMCAGLYRARERALDLRIRAELELGRHDGLVAQLTEMVAADPLNEQAVCHLAVALYRSGRRADALAACQQAKAQLVEQLGLDPGGELRRLELAILRADPVLEVARPPGPAANARDRLGAGKGPVPKPRPAATDPVEPPPTDPPTAAGDGSPASPAVTGGPVPAQLPAGGAVFVGRAGQLKALDASRRSDLPAPPAVGVTVAVVVGPAGVGKTALALHWAQRARDRFPDGQLYVDLRGYAETPPLRPIEALVHLLYGLGVPATGIPVDVDDAAGLFRTLMSDRCMLLLLDNASAADQVRPLLPGTGTSMALVTSREQLAGLIARDGAYPVVVDALTPEESLTLLTRTIDPDRASAEREATAQLAELCAHLPLALRIAAANLAMHPRTPIARYVAELRASHRLSGLEVAADPQASVRSAFQLSYRIQPADTRRLFRLLSLVPGSDFDLAGAAALAGVTSSAVHHNLSDLVRVHLVTDLDNGRYALHDLLRLFSRERNDDEDTDTERSAAVHRLLTHFLERSTAAAALAYPQLPRLPVPSAPDVAPFADASAGVAWLEAEHTNLVAAVPTAVASGVDQMAWLLATSLRGYFASHRYAVDWLGTAEAALSAARAVGDTLGLAAAHLGLGAAHRSLPRYPAAMEHLVAALSKCRQAGWRDGEANALSNLAVVYLDTGQLRRAADTADEALTLCRQLGLVASEAAQVGNRGVIRLWLGDLADATADFSAALRQFRANGNRAGEALMLTNLGWTYHYLGQFGPAGESLAAGLAIHREMRDRYGEILACSGLAELYAVVGRIDEAVACGTVAYELASAAGDKGAQALTLVALANAHRAGGAAEQAADHGAEAVQRAGQAQYRGMLTEAYLALAHAQRDLGRDEPATSSAEQVLSIARHDGYRVFEGNALTLLADLHQRHDDHTAAIATAEQALTMHRQTGHRVGEARTLTVLSAAHQSLADTHAAASYRQRVIDMNLSDLRWN